MSDELDFLANLLKVKELGLRNMKRMETMHPEIFYKLIRKKKKLKVLRIF